MNTRGHATLLILATLTLPLRAAPPDNDAKRELPARLKQMLHWLPTDTETLIVANGPFEISKKPKGVNVPTFQQALELLSVGMTMQLHDGLLRTQLQGQKIQIAIEGSRRFRSPKTLGLMPYEGCQILRFDDSSDAALQKAFKSCLEKAHKVIRLQDNQVAVFTEKWENDDWSLFVTRPQRRLLVCATSRAYLEEVLVRMQRKKQKRALPKNLPEWQHVDVKARVWAVRDYRKEEAEKDPSSPLRPAAAANVPDPKAVGFVFWYNADEKIAKARYLSGAKNAVEIATSGWHVPTENLNPKIQGIQPGVVEISTSVAKVGVGHIFLFVLLGYLGHGVYI